MTQLTVAFPNINQEELSTMFTNIHPDHDWILHFDLIRYIICLIGSFNYQSYINAEFNLLSQIISVSCQIRLTDI